MHAPTEESTHTHQHQINMAFANCIKEDVIHPLMVKEIAQAQNNDAVLKKLSKTDKYSTQLVEDTQVLCKDGKLVIPKFLCVETLVGITATCSILDTHDLRKHYMQRCIGKVEKHHPIASQKLSYMSS
jgi:hypothetical protein